jgi:hypothetical protein
VDVDAGVRLDAAMIPVELVQPGKSAWDAHFSLSRMEFSVESMTVV